MVLCVERVNIKTVNRLMSYRAQRVTAQSFSGCFFPLRMIWGYKIAGWAARRHS
jgi:hypothetical protein